MKQILGQHYLVDEDVIKRLIDSANIKPDDVVLEIGCGRGALTKELLMRGYFVLGYELDKNNFEFLLRNINSERFRLFNVDVFNEEPVFDVLISSLPYYQSSRFIEWICTKKYREAVVILQREFANKLIAEPNNSNYRAMSVVAQASSQIERLFFIPPKCFTPQPKVGSVALKLEFRRKLDEKTVDIIKHIFSQKNRKLRNIFKKHDTNLPTIFSNQRPIALYPHEVLKLVQELG